MKKTIITFATALTMLGSTWASPVKPEANFAKYISRQIAQNTSFASDGFQGTLTVKVKFSRLGIEAVTIVNGLEAKLDKEIVELIKNTPEIFVHQMLTDNVSEIVIPIKLVIAE
jgi:hypothetical protein